MWKADANFLGLSKINNQSGTRKNYERPLFSGVHLAKTVRVSKYLILGPPPPLHPDDRHDGRHEEDG